MGLFKGIKDIASMTKQAKELQAQQQADAGYKPGIAGQFEQMGDMLGQANEQLTALNNTNTDEGRILAEGVDAQGVIVGMGTPARGAMKFNLDIDLEVHVPGKAPYRVANEYIVPGAAQIAPGVTLPIKVDPLDPAKIAIDWNSAARGPARGEVRPAGGPAAGTVTPAPQAAASSPSASPAGDPVAELERLAKLRDSGALTDSEFEQQKARILGG